MDMRRLWLGLAVCLAVPATAFVFVPQRDDTFGQPRWRSALLPAPVRVTTDAVGTVYLNDQTQIQSLDPETGDPLWTYRPPDGYQVADVLCGDAHLVLVVRSAANPPEVLLTCVDAEQVESDAPVQVWQRRALEVPPGGVHLPLREHPVDGDLGFVVVLVGNELVRLNLADGRVLNRHTIGQARSAPVWRQGGGAVVVNQPDGGSRLVTFVFHRDAPPVSSPALPPGEAVSGLLQPSEAPTLLVRGGLATYASPFVLVPTRGDGPPLRKLAEASPDAVAAADDRWLTLATGQAVTLHDLETGGVRWHWSAPAGWTIDPPARVGAEVVVVALRPAADPRRLRLLALPLAAEPTSLWQHDLTGAPANAVHLPSGAESHPTGREVVAVLADRRLLVLDQASGESLASREVGAFAGPAIWVGDSGFVPTADGYRPDPAQPGQPALCGLDIWQCGTAADAAARWVWRLPADETIESLEWHPTGHLLLVRGRLGTYVF